MKFFSEQFFFDGQQNYSRPIRARSSISALVEAREDNVMSNSLITRLFKGFFNMNPPMKKRPTTWDPDDVLDVIQKWPPLEDLDILKLSCKTAFLVLITRVCHKNELLVLDIDHMDVYPDKIEFSSQTMVKTFSSPRPDINLLFFTIQHNNDVTSSIQ